ncbi:pentatricopeptide repeat-containing protein At2g19280 isoform X2 [Diospyros lotus]|uniref:pentatricopeptide repeat-containing protein At2g19280 isoform X2 n=1 Tax=Diospyros lotus TaxID=55363 RepID=UPI002256D32B|nr:pentatricopeptide repeat-containing protein At2g19280 isoform X2 [Diospyros lotus]XP_052199377.1 pentatricopeptide repeat-containing protein At2g19280 isoform X2 [Diospyros lotus]XP_052199378.1 pentatricopeptide repeat-containing protein At2g19280 isoform X2 [Diospyros lotus]
MRVSFSIFDVASTQLKLMLRSRRRISRFFSSASLTLPSSAFLTDEVFTIEDSIYLDDPVANPECIHAESAESGELFDRRFICQFVNENSFIYDYQNLENDKLKRIKLILRNCGWNLGAENGNKINLDEHNITRILNDLFLESLDASLALYFFRWSEYCTELKHTTRTICLMVQILIAGNMNYRAMDLIQYLVRLDGEDCKHNSLLSLFHETHTNRRVLATAYSMLVDSYIQQGMVDVALKLTSQMKHKSIFPSIGVCNSLIRALLGSEQLGAAWYFVEEMHSHGMVINASIISLFICKYCTEGNIEIGLNLLMGMRNYGFNPDIIAYTMVVDSLCKMCCVKEATSLLFKMTEMGITVDSVSVSSLIDGYCKVGRLDNAVDLLKIFKVPSNVYIYNSLLSKLCGDGNMIAAANMFQEMLELGFHPDCFSYTTIIGGYCKTGDIMKALNFLGRMLKRGVKKSVATYTMLVDGYCKSGNTDMAQNMFQKMVTEGLDPDIVAYNALMDGYGKNGLLHKAFEILDMMRSIGVSPDIVTYNTLIHSLIIRGYVTEAKAILDELIRRGFTPDILTFTNVIAGFSNKGNFEEAFLVWFYMNDHGMKPDVVTCSALLNGYCKVHRMEEANALFCKMLDIGLDPDLVLYNTLIHGFCSVGNINDARRLVNMMIENGVIPNEVTHRALVLGYEKKWVKNPVEVAALKLHQILLEHGICSDVNWYLTKM